MIEDIKAKGDQVGGKLMMKEDVVATIANYALRDVAGIAALGKAGILNRAIGPDPTRGVEAEVGETQAALDIDVVIEFGCDIHKVADEVRNKVAAAVFKMAGRKVVEVNINVVGIQMPEDEAPPKEEKKPRVK